MKARKFIGRDRTTAGRATGDLVCRLSIPSRGEDYDLRPLTDNFVLAVEKMRKFILHHLPKNPALLDNASFSIYAELRASSGALRRKRLARWKFGEDLTSVFDEAARAWKLLQIEEDWTSVEINI